MPSSSQSFEAESATKCLGAVYDDVLAGDVPGHGGAEEQDRVGDLHREAWAAQRQSLQHGGGPVGGHHALHLFSSADSVLWQHISGEVTAGYGVDPFLSDRRPGRDGVNLDLSSGW